MSAVRFSCVTISFNQARWLPAAIDSVLRQRRDGIDVEYIVCDPGSPDESRSIIDSYGDQIAVRVYEKDAGPADGLNRGFAHATGDIYCYVNADDYLLPGAFKRVADWFAAHPDVDVVTGHAFAVDENGTFLRKVWSEPFGRLGFAYGVTVQIQPSTFIRAEAFRRCGGFDPNDRANWDGDLLVSLYLAGCRFGMMDDFLSAYRLQSESITSSGKLAQQHQNSADLRFERLMGRKPGRADRALGRALRLLKHARWPARTWERMARGPMFMRSGWKPWWARFAG